MHKYLAAVLSLAMVVLVAAVPVIAADTDATGPGDITLTLPESSEGDSVHITVANDGSDTFRIYVFNGSDSYLVLGADGYSDSDGVDVSTSTSTDMLLPMGVSETGHIATVDVTVSIDKFNDNPTETATVDLKFTNMADNSVSFSIPVGIDITVDSTYYSEDGTNKFLGIIPNTLDGALGSEWFTAAVTLVAWVIIAWIVCMAIVPLFMRIFKSKSSDDDKRRTKKTLVSLFVVLIAVLAVNQCLTILGVDPESREGVELISNVLYIAIGALIAWTVYVFVVSALIRGMERGSDSAVDTSLIPLFKMVGKIIIAVCAAGSILALFGVDLNGILVSAGVITLGITLGAQNILNQFFSGIVLLSTRPFKKGDYVEINGQIYIVRKVKLMFTEFDNMDKDRVVTIPNNIVSGGTIVNMTREDEDTMVYVYVTVAYDSDLRLAQELMIEAAKANPEVITDGSRSPPSTRLTNFLDSSIELRLAAYIRNYKLNGAVAGQLREDIYRRFNERGVEIPFGRLDIVLQQPCDGRRKDDDPTIEGQ